MTTILITGAGRGIGFELARQAVDKGWSVIGSVRNVDAQRELASRIPEMAVLNFDVTDQAAMDKIANAFQRPIDVLVNNAGIIGDDPQATDTINGDAFEKLLATNVVAPLRVMQAFLPYLKASAHPRIVNISSIMGAMKGTSSGKVGYRASKAALNKLTQAMAEELAGDGITAVSMHPGWVRTDMGGPSASISPKESAFGILNVISQLTREDSGSFINYDGTRMDW